jgi:OTU-like cysteine protease
MELLKELSIEQFHETFKVIPNVGKGNCLFLAIAFFLPGETHRTVREKVANYYADHIAEHQDNIHFSVDHGKKIRNEFEWGDGSDIYIIGLIFDITIKMYNFAKDATTGYVGNILTEPPEKKNTIHILFSNGNHYEALSMKAAEKVTEKATRKLTEKESPLEKSVDQYKAEDKVKEKTAKKVAEKASPLQETRDQYKVTEKATQKVTEKESQL